MLLAIFSLILFHRVLIHVGIHKNEKVNQEQFSFICICMPSLSYLSLKMNIKDEYSDYYEAITRQK